MRYAWHSVMGSVAGSVSVDIGRMSCARHSGVFNEYKDEMRVGAMIECRLGVIEEGIKRYWLPEHSPKNPS